MEADLSQAMSSDNVEDTINYAEAVAIIQAEMQIPSALLEHVAGRILQHLQRQWPQIAHIDLSIAKLTPPIPNANVESCAVQVSL